jgi:proline iminopeptidase
MPKTYLGLTLVAATLGLAAPSVASRPSSFPVRPAATNGELTTPGADTGYVTSRDGIRLFFAKVGTGSPTVIVPGRLFLYRDFQRLAKGRTLIFYDMRNRGRSDAVPDSSDIGLQHDVDDLETVRAHFNVDRVDLIGWSYLGKIVMLYAIRHPEHVGRIIQIAPVARKIGTTFPAALTSGDANAIPDPAELKRLTDLFDNGFAKQHPQEYCEMEWKTEQQRMVGNPANASKIPSPCTMRNEWPTKLFAHFQALLASDQALDIPTESIAKVSAPVLTIHGTKDRNAPYGGGREWDMLLPNARLVTVTGAAHMSWIDFPETVFTAADVFLNGDWPAGAEQVKSLERTASRP